ncbi:MAG: lytic transglycosylase domain-containing protein, partial [Betaproteobacteria bacterium]
MLPNFMARLGLALALLTGGAPAASQAAADAPQALTAADQALLDIKQAFDRGERSRVQSLLPQVRGHILEPWAAYWEMRLRLADVPATDVQAFLSRWAGTYQEDRLRNDWLLMLGHKRDWLTFQNEIVHYRMHDDPEVRCYALWIDHL